MRYIQAALSYPQERESRLPTIATGDDFPHGPDPKPVLLYTASVGESFAPSGHDGSFAPQHVAGWSRFYEIYPRRPNLTHVVPPYVANHLRRLEGGIVGWGDHIKVARAVWELGPQSAIDASEADASRRWTEERSSTATPAASRWLRSLGSSMNAALESHAWGAIREGASSVVSATTTAAANVATSAAQLAERQMHMADVSRMRSEIASKKANWGARTWNSMRDGDLQSVHALFKNSLAEVEALELKIEAKAKMITDLESGAAVAGAED